MLGFMMSQTGSPIAWKSGKYPRFDPRYDIEFNEVINPYASRFLADHRRNKTTALSEEDRRWIERSEAPAQRDHPSASDSATPPVETFDGVCSPTKEKGYGIGRPETGTIRVPSILNGRLRWSMCHHRVRR